MSEELPNPSLSPARSLPALGASDVPNRHLNFLLVAMLLTLHGAIAWGGGEWWQRGFLLAHFGLFLIWQPVWRGERQVPLALALLVLCLGAFFAVAGNWWLIATWIAVLFGLIGGGVPGTVGRGDRLVAILGAVYLVAMLLMWVVPQLFTRYAVPPEVADMVRYGLPLLPLAMLVAPRDGSRRGAPVIVDLFYSLMLFLLVVALALGSFVIQEIAHGQYLLGLAQALMVIALLLAGLSWLWNPRAGFSGIGTLLSRYLLGLGLPFELRMRRLAELAQTEPRPERFLHDALTYLLELPWVTGLGWQSAHSGGEVGRTAAHAEHYETGGLRFTLHAARPFSPAVLLHLKLLMQMVGHFHEALRREQVRRQSAYAQAIYETGARLTHDVKNLLQSLRSICAAAEMRGVDDNQAFRALVQRQLPQITQRLGTTLEKLKSPGAIEMDNVDAGIWWQGLQARYAGRGVVFLSEAVPAGEHLPAELFDSTADTLIENALYKASRDGALRISVALSAGPRLTVCDDGAPVPPAIENDLLSAPVSSESGLGVGLFQAAKFAAQSGYALVLAENRRGRVCFELKRSG
ncbi:MAG: HAMP domain-containing histidine kinase [Burkholderiales bacterium]|nr:HAMP domain-containing histidine kinase [Burkholderiales bacterium]